MTVLYTCSRSLCDFFYTLKKTPRGFVICLKLTFLLLFFRWYFGKIKRIEAEKKLLLAQNEHGAYLIRKNHMPKK